MVEDRARAPEIAEALIRSGGPIVVVGINGFHATAAGDRRETRAGQTCVGATKAGGGGALLIAAGLVAEGAAAVVIEREFIEAVVHIRKQNGAFPAPGGREDGGEAQARGEFVAGVGVAVEGDVVAKAVAAALVHGEAHHEALGVGGDKRPAESETAFAQGVLAGVGLDAARPERSRGVGHEADDAARGVGAKGPSLRPAQHLDLAHIKRAAERAEAGEIHVVDHEAHGGIGSFAFVLGIFADAADLEITGPRSATRPREI